MVRIRRSRYGERRWAQRPLCRRPDDAGGATVLLAATNRMTGRAPWWRGASAVEAMLAVAVLLGVLSVVRALAMHGYLPQPFYYPSDSLMDLYNPAYWAHRD